MAVRPCIQLTSFWKLEHEVKEVTRTHRCRIDNRCRGEFGSGGGHDSDYRCRGESSEAIPHLIKQVEHSARPDYFSDYKVRFVPGVFKEVPTFCSVSVVDVRSNDNIYYGHAKLGSFPAINYVNVLTLKVGDDKPAGDSSMSFLLMCVK